MDFSYQSYVKKMEYDPYAWPPDISLAGLHSRCSEPGKQNPVGVSCPCCGYTIKLKIDGWVRRDIYQDFQSTGAGIPSYFALLRFYNLMVLVLFLVNAPYFTYSMNKACNYDSNKCVSVGLLYFLDFATMINILNSKFQYQMVNNLMILQTVVFYILLVANNLSIFYLVYISRKCKQLKRSTKRFMSLIVENFQNGTTEQQIKEMLRLPNGKKPKIHSITFVNMLYEYNKIFKQRVLAFYELKAMYIECINPKKQVVKNQKLKELNDKYNKFQEMEALPKIKAIVMFQNHKELMEIYEKYRYRQFFHWAERIYNWFAGEKKKTQIFVNFLPELSQTLWINMGEDHKVKLISKIISIGTTILMLIVCYILFYYPLMFTLGVHSSQHSQTKMTLAQKFLPTLVGLGLVGISIMFRMYMQKLGRDRRPRTNGEQSQFILTTTIMFHLIFYLIIPNIFFIFSNGIQQSVKLFAISSQAQTFLVVQFILSFFDSIYRFWKMKKMKTLADQRQSFKFPQKFLHERVQYREYPIEIKLIVMFKIWSMVLFYSFFVPLIMLYVVIALVALYLLEKRNIYQHYVVKKHLSSRFQIKFLNLYINFFCIYQCFIYIINVQSTWQQIAAAVSTIVSLLLQLIYWQILKKRENRRQRHKIMKAQIDVRRSLNHIPSSSSETQKTTKGLQEQLLQSEKQYQSDDDQDEDPTYGNAYEKFLQQYRQPKLNQEIQNYLSSNVVQFQEVKEKSDHESQKSFKQPGRERNKTFQSIELV